jgi:hypothetical protein
VVAAELGRNCDSVIRASADAGNAQACAFLGRVSADGSPERFGVGMDINIVTALVKAPLSGVNRLAWLRGGGNESSGLSGGCCKCFGSPSLVKYAQEAIKSEVNDGLLGHSSRSFILFLIAFLSMGLGYRHYPDQVVSQAHREFLRGLRVVSRCDAYPHSLPFLFAGLRASFRLPFSGLLTRVADDHLAPSTARLPLAHGTA